MDDVDQDEIQENVIIKNNNKKNTCSSKKKKLKKKNVENVYFLISRMCDC